MRTLCDGGRQSVAKTPSLYTVGHRVGLAESPAAPLPKNSRDARSQPRRKDRNPGGTTKLTPPASPEEGGRRGRGERQEEAGPD
ncbi:hypothetical protein COCON_G00229860 [Conger conger]|uniref:Uncharacterized protein n=1 Tax=Conger conger TaxID=82655 RepID=A0A9Q1CUF1_CONCO|nr:hypothetical protein COCON_G00229860 [Conger conger]